MKGTEQFKATIQAHLESVASQDALFAKTLAKENKNIDDCVTYILNQVQKSGCNGFADSEIFGMAVHYYDEDDIKVGEPIKSGSVVVNHQIELSAEEIAKAKQAAIEQAIEDERQRIASKKSKPKTEAKTDVVQPSLF